MCTIQFSFTFSTHSHGSSCSPLATSSLVPSGLQLAWAVFLSPSAGAGPAEFRTPQGRMCHMSGATRREGMAGDSFHMERAALGVSRGHRAGDSTLDAEGCFPRLPAPADPVSSSSLLVCVWDCGQLPAQGSCLLSPRDATVPVPAAWLTVCSMSPGCHSACASCMAHSVLNVTFPRRAGSRAGRDRTAPGDPEPLILHQLQGHLLTFRATGPDARALHLHSLQQGAQGLLFIFTNGKKTPHLAAVTPHSQH